jgi:hypothetical protein
MATKYVPTDTITWTDSSVTLSQLATAALLEFASTDETRTHLCSVGVSDGQLAATDGHTLLRYDAPQREPVKALLLHGKTWSRAYVTRELAEAKLDKRDVVLKFEDLSTEANFPPIAQVVTEPGFGKGKSHKQEPVALNPEYLARMVKVCKALGNQGCLLTSMRGETDPVMYRVDGRKGCDIQATIVIMPMRY